MNYLPHPQAHENNIRVFLIPAVNLPPVPLVSLTPVRNWPPVPTTLVVHLELQYLNDFSKKY
jgi:hypothetical protein